MNWFLREAQKADQKRIAELFLEMLRTIYQTEEVTGYQNGDLDRFFSGGEHRIYVAQCDGNVIAFLSIEVYRLPDLAYLYLDDFCVSEQYRGLGIGTQLLKTAEQYAQTLGISKIVLHVEKSNTAARRLYERFGYQIMKDEGHRYRMAK